MEATVIFVEHARLQDAEAAPLVKGVKKKIQLLCEKPAGLRHMSLWIHTPDFGACRPLAQLAGSKCPRMTEGKAYPCSELSDLIAGLFPTRPTKRNPAVLNCYSLQSEQPTQASPLQASFPFTDHVQLKTHFISGGSSLSRDLSKVILREMRTFEIDRMAHFSLLASPELISLYLWGPQRVTPLESGQVAPDIPADGEVVKGLRSKKCSTKDAVLAVTDRRHQDWLLYIQGDAATLVRQGGDARPGGPEALLCAYGVGGLKGESFQPQIISNPHNGLIYELYSRINSCLSTGGGSKSLAELTTKLEHFVRVANENQATLFPRLAQRPEHRTRAITTAVLEFKKLPIPSKSPLRKILWEWLGKIDLPRIEGAAEVKKARLSEKTLNDPASPFAECKVMVPYLDMGQPEPTHRPKTALDLPAGSVPGLYWRFREMVVDEGRLQGRKYWQQ